MTQYRPKLIFQSNSMDREGWAELAANPILRRAILHMQADMAFAGFTDPQMQGVNFFILGLLNLSENEPEAKVIPAKVLKSFEPDSLIDTK